MPKNIISLLYETKDALFRYRQDIELSPFHEIRPYLPTLHNLRLHVASLKPREREQRDFEKRDVLNLRNVEKKLRRKEPSQLTSEEIASCYALCHSMITYLQLTRKYQYDSPNKSYNPIRPRIIANKT